MMFLQAVADVMPVSTELPALISSSALTVSVIQWMKNSNLPLFKAFSQQSSGLNRTLAWLISLAAGVGIHYQYNAALGALTITGLTGPAIVSAAINATKSYAFTWYIYNTAVKTRAADVAAVAEAAPKKPTIVVSPGVAQAGKEMAAAPKEGE